MLNNAAYDSDAKLMADCVHLRHQRVLGLHYFDVLCRLLIGSDCAIPLVPADCNDDSASIQCKCGAQPRTIREDDLSVGEPLVSDVVDVETLLCRSPALMGSEC